VGLCVTSDAPDADPARDRDNVPLRSEQLDIAFTFINVRRTSSRSRVSPADLVLWAPHLKRSDRHREEQGARIRRALAGQGSSDPLETGRVERRRMQLVPGALTRRFWQRHPKQRARIATPHIDHAAE
jgi:hypothetical protein